MLNHSDVEVGDIVDLDKKGVFVVFKKEDKNVRVKRGDAWYVCWHNSYDVYFSLTMISKTE